MTSIGIMIEGQEDLTWERWLRLAQAAEELGFECLFRSDHLLSLDGHSERATLALWPSLTALALRTQRIRFGPLVSPMTFRHPVLVAQAAAAVSVLANGRLDLGLGAGWNDYEHRVFGVAYPPYRVRLEMLDEGAEVIKRLWSGETTSFTGKHYRLDAARTFPLPVSPLPRMIMGGKGERTLGIIARHADEWNFTYQGVEEFQAKSQQLDEKCLAVGRDPASLRRSLMIPFVIGRDAITVQKRIDAQRSMFAGLPATLGEWQAAGFPGGLPDQVLAQLKAFASAGVTRFMLQQNDLDDLDSLELLAREILPHFG